MCLILNRAHRGGVFQLESADVELHERVKTTEFVAGISLYRPGPMDFILQIYIRERIIRHRYLRDAGIATYFSRQLKRSMDVSFTSQEHSFSSLAISFVGIFKRSKAQKRKSPAVRSGYCCFRFRKKFSCIRSKFAWNIFQFSSSETIL